MLKYDFSLIFAGFPLLPLPLQMHRFHFKHPITNFPHTAHHHGFPSSYGSNFGIDKLISTPPLPFVHHPHGHHRLIDISDSKIAMHLSSPVLNSNSSSSNNPGAHHQSSPKRKRSWSRAVFSQLQRKGLEIQFQIQKYITKPDRRKLAARLGLTDAQVN